MPHCLPEGGDLRDDIAELWGEGADCVPYCADGVGFVVAEPADAVYAACCGGEEVSVWECEGEEGLV